MSADTSYIMSSHPPLTFSVYISTSATDHGLLHASCWSIRKQRKKLCAIFTQMQDDPQQNNWWEKSFNINFKHLINMSDSIYLYLKCHCHHLIVSAFIFLTLTPNIPTLFTAIPQCIIIRSTHYTGRRRVFNPFTVTCSDMCFYAMMIHLQRGVTLDFMILP